jgi:UDP-N-acetylmuramoyl-tripeptide--D-alanyl-D-alanine ligase
MVNQKLLEAYRRHPSVNKDTRNLKEGDLYIALKGDNFDGNAFAAAAIGKGAACVVVDNADYHKPEDPRYIWVPDALEALQQLATAIREEWAFPVFGLTGSNGKTTTKELIYSVLVQEKRVFATEGNLNNHIGVPLSLLAVPEDLRVAVIEMGANKPDDIADLCQIAKPTHGLITNIGRAHLEGMGGLDGIMRTKGALFDWIREHDGVAFVNEADPRVRQLAKGIKRTITYGGPDSDYQYSLKRNIVSGMDMEVYGKKWNRALRLTTRISGEYNCLNILAAIAVGRFFGVSQEGIRDGIYAYVPQNNRSQIIRQEDRTIILDAYNANPTSMEAAIRNAFDVRKQKVVLILGDMLELGAESEQAHKEIGELINTLSPVRTIGIGPQMKAMVGVLRGEKQWFANTTEAIAKIAELTEEAEIVLIKGSRGMALERLLEKFS